MPTTETILHLVGNGMIALLMFALRKIYSAVTHFVDKQTLIEQRLERVAEMVDLHSECLHEVPSAKGVKMHRVSHRRRKEDQDDEYTNDYGMLSILFALALVSASFSACIPVPAPKPPTPPAAATVRAVATVVSGAAGPIVGAKCELQVTSTTWLPATTVDQGYALWPEVPVNLPNTAVRCDMLNYFHYEAPRVLRTKENENLDPVVMTVFMPKAPTRDEILRIRISFQGLNVHTIQFGDLPWFEPALAWLDNLADRQTVYAAKHASTAWTGGDTHLILGFRTGHCLYDEPNQPYTCDRFAGGVDWTNGDTKMDPVFVERLVEAIRAGFGSVMIFLAGDDGENGFPIAMHELDLVADALQNSPYGDLRPYVIVYPGWDGVFYGYTPQHIYDWGAKCRTRFLYCGIEFSTGHIPAGEGPGEWWAPKGPMRVYDSVLAEFDDDRFDDTVWQIAGRLLGPAYHRPADQPKDDDNNPPFYLRDATERGPIVHCAFEFGEYGFVHRQYDADHVNTKQRPYFTSVGYTCGG